MKLIYIEHTGTHPKAHFIQYSDKDNLIQNMVLKAQVAFSQGKVTFDLFDDNKFVLNTEQVLRNIQYNLLTLDEHFDRNSKIDSFIVGDKNVVHGDLLALLSKYSEINPKGLQEILDNFIVETKVEKIPRKQETKPRSPRVKKNLPLRFPTKRDLFKHYDDMVEKGYDCNERIVKLAVPFKEAFPKGFKSGQDETDKFYLNAFKADVKNEPDLTNSFWARSRVACYDWFKLILKEK